MIKSIITWQDNMEPEEFCGGGVTVAPASGSEPQLKCYSCRPPTAVPTSL